MVFNDLLDELCASGDGVKIGGINAACPTFADDMSLVSLYKPALQRQLDRAYAYSIKWRFKYNATKSEILVFGDDDSPNKCIIKLGNDTIPVVKSSKHMGVILTQSVKEETEFIKDRISSGKRSYYAVQGIGSHSVPITPSVASKLYWSISVPRMTYGLEIIKLSPKATESLEVAHTSVARQIQGLPKQSANVCIGALGWWSLETYMDMVKIMFLWRIMNLSACSIYKKVLLVRLAYHSMQNSMHSGPTWWIMQTYNKYNILHVLQNALVTGTFASVHAFKNMMKRNMKEYERKCYAATLLLYSGMLHYVEFQLNFGSGGTMPQRSQRANISAG